MHVTIEDIILLQLESRGHDIARYTSSVIKSLWKLNFFLEELQRVRTQIPKIKLPVILKIVSSSLKIRMRDLKSYDSYTSNEYPEEKFLFYFERRFHRISFCRRSICN